MDDQDKILIDLYTLWVEAQVLGGVDQHGEDLEELGDDSTLGAAALWGRTSSEADTGVNTMPAASRRPLG